MATRFYLPVSGTAGAVSPALAAAWNANTGSPTRLEMPTTASGSTITNISRTVVYGAGATDKHFVGYQWISRRLNGAQSISGTPKLIIGQCLSDLASAGDFYWIIRVVDEAGTTVRGTHKAGEFANVWMPITTASSVTGTQAVGTTVSASDKDRIVFEFGFTVYSGSRVLQCHLGDNAGSDFAMTDALTTDLNPYMELASTHTFLAEATGGGSTGTNQLMLMGVGT